VTTEILIADPVKQPETDYWTNYRKTNSTALKENAPSTKGVERSPATKKMEFVESDEGNSPLKEQALTYSFVEPVTPQKLVEAAPQAEMPKIETTPEPAQENKSPVKERKKRSDRKKKAVDTEVVA